MPSSEDLPLDGTNATIPEHLSATSVLEQLPVGAYVCARDGRIIRYNAAAAALWGRKPTSGADERFCGSHRLFDLDDRHVPHADCPMAIALATGRHFHDQRIKIERPDGSRIIALVNIQPLMNDSGTVAGAVNIFRQTELPERHGTSDLPGDVSLGETLQALPAAIYFTDADGKITFYNEAAVSLWGVRPEIGRSEFCGSWKLFRPDGTPLPHDQCPMAVALKERTAIRGEEAAAERPDGTRIPFLAYPTPLFDAKGALIGAVNMLIDISGRKSAEIASQRLAAIVESSDDAILSKDVNGIITSWNRGAERLYGYREDEVLGQPVTLLIPLDRQDEEPQILARIHNGERIEHYETVRQKKDGSLVDVSLSVSPIFDGSGKVIGASKIARDISERRRAEQQKDLLLREMDHRVKNLFALASGLVNVSAAGAASVRDLASDLQSKFRALARSHTLTLSTSGTDLNHAATLHKLIAEVTEPYRAEDGSSRVKMSGEDFALGRTAMTSIALLLHEFATNALKYGALADPEGEVRVDISSHGDDVRIVWREAGVNLQGAGSPGDGFGSRLARATVAAMNGHFERNFMDCGLEIVLTIPRAQVQQ
jgi:PAS domain S-box-containing protein